MPTGSGRIEYSASKGLSRFEARYTIGEDQRNPGITFSVARQKSSGEQAFVLVDRMTEDFDEDDIVYLIPLVRHFMKVKGANAGGGERAPLFIQQSLRTRRHEFRGTGAEPLATLITALGPVLLRRFLPDSGCIDPRPDHFPTNWLSVSTKGPTAP